MCQNVSYPTGFNALYLLVQKWSLTYRQIGSAKQPFRCFKGLYQQQQNENILGPNFLPKALRQDCWRVSYFSNKQRSLFKSFLGSLKSFSPLFQILQGVSKLICPIEKSIEGKSHLKNKIKVFSHLLLSRRFHLQKSDLFGPRTIKHSGRGAKRNWCNFLLFYSKMHLGTEIKDKVVVQPTCFSKVGFRLPPQLPPLWNGEKKMLHKYHYKSLPNVHSKVQVWQTVLNCFANQTLKCHP